MDQVYYVKLPLTILTKNKLKPESLDMAGIKAFFKKRKEQEGQFTMEIQI